MDDRREHINTSEYRKKQQKLLGRKLHKEAMKQKKVPHHWRVLDKTLVSFFIILISLMYVDRAPKSFEPAWGISFSKVHAESLGLNWEESFESMLRDLPALSRVRISAYWPEVEPQKGVYDFQALDEQIALAQKYHKKITLALGYRLPRWPECHFPDWINNLSQTDRHTAVLNIVDKVATRYQGVAEVDRWQIENEPFLTVFGKCPPLDRNLFQKEIALVKKIDPHPVLLTDSGELGTWQRAARLADVFGTTLYRTVTLPWGSYLNYFFIPPGFYRLKARFLVGSIDKTIISELQAEPWSENKLLPQLSTEEINQSLSTQQLKDNLEFARQTGFKEVYLWGAEWWYYMKQIGYPEYWDIIKNLR